MKSAFPLGQRRYAHESSGRRGTIGSMKRTYLDWAAAAPVARRARAAFVTALDAFGNPSSPHAEGRAARDILEDARTRIARLAGVKPDAVLFTAGATEANALALVGFVRALWDAGREPSGMHVLFLPSAHASTRGCMDELSSWGVIVEPLSVPDGRIDLGRLRAQIRPETVLVALEAVCGETGARFDTRGVRRALDEARKAGGARIMLHADASQLPLAESFLLTRLAPDTLTLDSQKVGGVRGAGVLIAPRHMRLSPLIRGGGQERGLRPGTPSSALATAFAVALEEAQDGCVAFSLRASQARERLVARLLPVLPDLRVNEGALNVAHILNVSLPGRDTDYLAALLDEAGYAVSTKSACATEEASSNAVLAFTGDEARASSTLRISWGPTTPMRDLGRFAAALERAVRFLDANVL